MVVSDQPWYGASCGPSARVRRDEATRTVVATAAGGHVSGSSVLVGWLVGLETRSFLGAARAARGPEVALRGDMRALSLWFYG